MVTDFEEFSSDLDAGFGKRIDELLSSAIEEQTRDQRQLVETLEKAHLETKRLREVIESRKDNVTDVLEARLSGIATDEGVRQITESLEQRLDVMRALLDRFDPSLRSAIEDLSSELVQTVQSTGARNFDRVVKIQEDLQNISDVLNEIPEKVSQQLDQMNTEWRAAAAASSRQMEQIVSKVGSRLDEDLEAGQQALAAVSRQIEHLRAAVDDQPLRLSEQIQASVEPFAEEIRGLSARVRKSSMKSSEVTARLDALHQSLVAYLAQRDERLERSRDAVLAQLIEGIGRHLKRKDRTSIAEALRRANETRQDRRDAKRYRKMISAASAPNLERVAKDLEDAAPPVLPAKKSSKPAVTPRIASGAKGRRRPAV